MRVGVLVVLVLSCLAVASAAQWKVIDRDYAPVLIGISAVDNNTVYMSGGQDGTPPIGGPQVYKSTNAGKNWALMPHAGSAMMFLDVAFGTATSGVVGGIGLVGIVPGIEYTLNGQHFNASAVIQLASECQSVETIGGVKGGFGLAGEFGKANGAAVSVDGGITFRFVDAKLNTSARYGAYPSANTWYISAGDWPESKLPTAPGEKRLSQRISLHRDPLSNTMKPSIKLYDAAAPPRPLSPDDTYHAAIAKTTDAGKTWSTVYYDQGNFYFNGISCTTDDHCWAVGEADNGPRPGSRILHTNDGGKTWEEQLYNKNPAYSLMAIEMLSETEGWAAGGELDAAFQGQFWQTVDGGKTWKDWEVWSIYGNDLSFVKSAKGVKGFATAFTLESQSAVCIYE